VLLPGAALDNARDVAERLRAAVSGAQISYVDGSPLPSLTVSIGAAQMGEAATPAALVERADRALYRAKEAGRDRVEG
jgi:diguanylate cyclase (GGDEF)-like protein